MERENNPSFFKNLIPYLIIMTDVSHARTMIHLFYEFLVHLPREIVVKRISPNTWTVKEAVGHLIDSAANNHQRFIRLQEGNLETFPNYKNDSWVAIQEYNNYPWNRLVEFWREYNMFLLHVIDNVEKRDLKNKWALHEKNLSLECLINDYFIHLEGHVEKIKEKIQRLHELSDNHLIS